MSSRNEIENDPEEIITPDPAWRNVELPDEPGSPRGELTPEIEHQLDNPLPAPFPYDLSEIRRHIETDLRCRSTRPDWREHFLTNRFGEYKLNRAWWECKIWPKPPAAIDRRLPTDEGVRF